MSSALNLHYSHNWAYEIEYSPNGVNSGMCVGTASTAVNLTPVVLVPCGASAKSVWVVDSQDSIGAGYVPLINGSGTNFSHPYVLHYPGNSFPRTRRARSSTRTNCRSTPTGPCSTTNCGALTSASCGNSSGHSTTWRRPSIPPRAGVGMFRPWTG